MVQTAKMRKPTQRPIALHGSPQGGVLVQGHLFIRQQTSVINAIRAHMAEFGIVARVGRTGVAELLAVAADPTDRRLPEAARSCVAALGVQLRMLKAQILAFDRWIGAWHRSN